MLRVHMLGEYLVRFFENPDSGFCHVIRISQKSDLASLTHLKIRDDLHRYLTEINIVNDCEIDNELTRNLKSLSETSFYFYF